MLDGSGNVFLCYVFLLVDSSSTLSWDPSQQAWVGSGPLYCATLGSILFLQFSFDRYGRLFYSCDQGETWNEAVFVARSGTLYDFYLVSPCGCPETFWVRVAP